MPDKKVKLYSVIREAQIPGLDMEALKSSNLTVAVFMRTKPELIHELSGIKITGGATSQSVEHFISQALKKKGYEVDPPVPEIKHGFI